MSDEQTELIWRLCSAGTVYQSTDRLSLHVAWVFQRACKWLLRGKILRTPSESKHCKLHSLFYYSLKSHTALLLLYLIDQRNHKPTRIQGTYIPSSARRVSKNVGLCFKPPPWARGELGKINSERQVERQLVGEYCKFKTPFCNS